MTMREMEGGGGFNKWRSGGGGGVCVTMREDAVGGKHGRGGACEEVVAR